MAGSIVVRELLTRLGVQADTSNVDAFARAVADVKGEMQQAAGVAKGVLTTALGNLAASLARGVGMAARSAAMDLLQTNFEAERMGASLETITGSAEGAVAAFEQIKRFTADTPFALANVTEAWIRLANVGIEPTDEVMKSVGNTAAAFGKDIVEFADAVVAATTGEMERLKMFGIVAKQEGSKVTFTFRGVKTTIKKDSKEIAKFLFDLGNNQFAGALERQMKTLPGLFSNLKDNVSLFWLTMGKEGGLNDAIRELLKALIGTSAAGKPLAVILGRILANAVRKLTATIEFLRRNSDGIMKVLSGLLSLVVLLGLQAVLTSKWFKNLSLVLQRGFVKGKITAAFKALNAAMTPATIKAVLLAAALLIVFLAIEDLVGFMTGKDSVIGQILGDKEEKRLRTAIQKIVDAFMKGWNAISGALEKFDVDPFSLIAIGIEMLILAFATLIVLLVWLGEQAGIVAAKITMWFVEKLLPDLKAAWELLPAFFIWLGGIINGIIDALWGGIVASAKQTLGVLEAIFGGMFNAFKMVFIDPVLLLVDLLGRALSAVVDGVLANTKRTIQWVVDKVGWAQNALEDIGILSASGGGFAQGAQAIAQSAGLVGAPATTGGLNVGGVTASVTVITDSNDPEAVGEAAAAGTADGMDSALRDAERALAF
jgi:hypothetical protein